MQCSQKGTVGIYQVFGWAKSVTFQEDVSVCRDDGLNMA